MLYIIFFPVRIKCKDLVKKIAIYKNRLAVSSFLLFLSVMKSSFVIYFVSKIVLDMLVARLNEKY